MKLPEQVHSSANFLVSVLYFFSLLDVPLILPSNFPPLQESSLANEGSERAAGEIPRRAQAVIVLRYGEWYA